MKFAEKLQKNEQQHPGKTMLTLARDGCRSLVRANRSAAAWIPFEFLCVLVKVEEAYHRVVVSWFTFLLRTLASVDLAMSVSLHCRLSLSYCIFTPWNDIL